MYTLVEACHAVDEIRLPAPPARELRPALHILGLWVESNFESNFEVFLSLLGFRVPGGKIWYSTGRYYEVRGFGRPGRGIDLGALSRTISTIFGIFSY
eukprot:SAG31_NODE_20222_length_580_cov_2.669439_1_plen_97_part_10